MDHYVDIVNEKDEVISKELKSKKLEFNFISRLVVVLIRDSGGKFIICKRAAYKKFGAGKYDCSACGNVRSGENYQQAAHRELQEELNIQCPLTMLDKLYLEVENNAKFFIGIFFGKSDEKPQLNHELDSFKKLTVKKIEKEIRQTPENFCLGFINDFNKIKEKLKSIS